MSAMYSPQAIQHAMLTVVLLKDCGRMRRDFKEIRHDARDRFSLPVSGLGIGSLRYLHRHGCQKSIVSGRLVLILDRKVGQTVSNWGKWCEGDNPTQIKLRSISISK
jgi:hypothetical protein